MLEEAPGRVAFLTRSLTRDPAKSVTELTNLQDIDGGIPGLKRCCVDDEVSIPMFRADFPRFTLKLVEVWPNLPSTPPSFAERRGGMTPPHGPGAVSRGFRWLAAQRASLRRLIAQAFASASRRQRPVVLRSSVRSARTPALRSPLCGLWAAGGTRQRLAPARFVPSGALHVRRFHDACLVCWKETSRQTADQAVAKMQVGRAMHEAGLVARSGAGGRGPDESGDRVSAAAADANGRRSGLARQTPGTCRQSVRCGPYLAGRVLPAPSARVRKSGPSPAGGAV
jgi:hypothetical protein